MKLEHLQKKLTEIRKDFGKIGGMTGVTVVLPTIGSLLMLTVIYQISPWLQNNQQIGFLFFVSFMTIFSGLALIATNILGVVSGFAFDFQIGVVAQMTGLVGASTLMFLLTSRYISKNFLATIEKKPKLKAIHHALLNESVFKTLLIITLIRLSPAMPFAGTNFIISASGVSFRTFILGTILGMSPRATALVFVGSSLSELNFSEPQEAWLVILGIVATILSIIVISIVGKRALNKLIVEQGI